MFRFIEKSFQKVHLITYKGLIFAVIFFYLAQLLIGETLGKLCSKLLEMICTNDDEVKNEAHSDDFYKELLINPLTDINNKAIQEYENF